MFYLSTSLTLLVMCIHILFSHLLKLLMYFEFSVQEIIARGL